MFFFFFYVIFFFFKQKTAYEIYQCDWSSDVCSSDLVERAIEPHPMSVGDMYSNPGDCAALPTDLRAAVAAFEGSSLAGQLGQTFSECYLCIARHEIALADENSPDPDAVNDWERARFAEHS